MRSLPLGVLLFSLFANATLATADSERAVLQAEQARIAALVADDYAALNRLLADDMTYTHSNASVDTKAAFIESLTSGRLKYKELEHRDQKVRVYGDAAVLTGTTRVYSIAEGKDVRLQLRFTIVYVKQFGHWRFAAWQSTRVP